ncbi:hypothetical protein CHLNCDRAFT_133367 [Chlorella variabilis]|uniref:Uncharacterized protein n=1 Tax=Chlorella variabilis TaxID=554065 RepID=E1Z2Y4_CHLVA|nr:hypothetical protein CHLNCDRAFT_133367 [Chlorella variabilis]EFN60074.1 hypothetical protein CHLNCDRAFT_133367 [Chlorella variabilis]|eukprot:XP_005852176.1 hypothetical protein CHLNCDRAFT_133367 [Chlorella variabilis]
MAAETRAPLNVAILGAGSFVRDAYLGPLQANSDKLLVTALWSRSAESVWALLPAIQQFSASCQPYHGEGGLQALLGSAGLDAVLVVLPPQAQGPVIQAALRAGGSMDAFLRLRDAIASGHLGTIARLDMAADLAMSPSNKYYDSAWRRDNTGMPGAYLTEGGVHFVAALRMAAKAAGYGEAVAAAAGSRGIAADLPHPDTLLGTLLFESGAAAGYSVTLAAGRMSISLQAVGTAGAGEVVRGGWGAQGRAFRLLQQAQGDAAPTEMESGGTGLEAELLSFARLARAAAPVPGGANLTLTAREAGAAVATDGSDPEPDAVTAGGSRAGAGGAEVAAARDVPVAVEEPAGMASPLADMPSEEDAYRIRCVEAVRDLAVVTAMLESAAAGGQRVPVAQV